MGRIRSNWSHAMHMTSLPSNNIETPNRVSTLYQIGSLEDHIM
jgi:hypothetical protein